LIITGSAQQRGAQMDKGDVFLKDKELPLLKTSSNSGY
jgi:hypothetical protein